MNKILYKIGNIHYIYPMRVACGLLPMLFLLFIVFSNDTVPIITVLVYMSVIFMGMETKSVSDKKNLANGIPISLEEDSIGKSKWSSDLNDYFYRICIAIEKYPIRVVTCSLYSLSIIYFLTFNIHITVLIIVCMTSSYGIVFETKQLMVSRDKKVESAYTHGIDYNLNNTKD